MMGCTSSTYTVRHEFSTLLTPLMCRSSSFIYKRSTKLFFFYTFFFYYAIGPILRGFVFGGSLGKYAIFFLILNEFGPLFDGFCFMIF